MQASITAGYYKHGLIHAAPPGDILDRHHPDHLVSFDGLKPGEDARTNYATWMQHDDVTKVTGAAVSIATSAISEHVVNFGP